VRQVAPETKRKRGKDRVRIDKGSQQKGKRETTEEIEGREAYRLDKGCWRTDRSISLQNKKTTTTDDQTKKQERERERPRKKKRTAVASRVWIATVTGVRREARRSTIAGRTALSRAARI
jgi:hypothetical protein